VTYKRLFDPDSTAKPADPGSTRKPVDLGARNEGERRRVGDRATSSVYVYTDEITLAVNVALATDRPLLVRGVSGSGKSSLARDVAERLDWRYRVAVVTSRTNARDLQWSFDAVRRLSEAASGLPLREPRAFVRPGELWWAFDAASARRQARAASAKGGDGADAATDVEGGSTSAGGSSELDDDRPAVVLIDEIDKADPDVPNDLLVPFGSLTFEVTETHETVTAPVTRRPLLVLTTNEERDLPPAFLRRCVELRLRAPNQDRLVNIGRAHFPDADDARLRTIAGQFVPEAAGTGEADATASGDGPVPIASTAEYLDAIQASLDLNVRPDSSDTVWTQVLEAIIGKPVGGTPPVQPQ
jgi:MoxR-like ATPase